MNIIFMKSESMYHVIMQACLDIVLLCIIKSLLVIMYSSTFCMHVYHGIIFASYILLNNLLILVCYYTFYIYIYHNIHVYHYNPYNYICNIYCWYLKVVPLTWSHLGIPYICILITFSYILPYYHIFLRLCSYVLC